MFDRTHVHFHVNSTLESNPELRTRLDLITAALSALTTQGAAIMATLQAILDDEAQEATALGQLATAVQQLQGNIAALTQQLADALSGATLPADVQAKIDAAFAASKANIDQVGAILASIAPHAA